jgi:hypothetical protein
MKLFKNWALGTVSVLAAGCSAAEPAQLRDDASLDPANETEVPGAPEPELLAQVDFDDGNVVTFERLGKGILILEIGPEGNPRRFEPRGDSAVESFRRLSPVSAVPEALIAADSRFAAPPGAVFMKNPMAAYMRDGRLDESAMHEALERVREALPEEPERTGQFEQAQGSYPWSTFELSYCNWEPALAYDFKHADADRGHTHATPQSHRTYSAVGSDIGDVSVQMCADGGCNPWHNVAQGEAAVVDYDAGFDELEICPPWFDPRGCEWAYFARYPAIELKSSNVSAGERFHECAWFESE